VKKPSAPRIDIYIYINGVQEKRIVHFISRSPGAFPMAKYKVKAQKASRQHHANCFSWQKKGQKGKKCFRQGNLLP
jgi:hypothetical protein